jgi:hypothetical protein
MILLNNIWQIGNIATQLIYLKRIWKNSMAKFFTDDIDLLIKQGHGDTNRLIKIKEEFVRTKIVSIEDRKYVEGLLMRYIHTTDLPKNDKPKAQHVISTPSVILPTNPPKIIEAKPIPKVQESIIKTTSKRKIRNIAIASSLTAVGVLAVFFIAMNPDFTISIPATPKVLEVDSASYSKGDIISIFGKTKKVTSSVRLSISNPSGEQIWTETVNVKSNGMFSTLVIAGGQGWDQDGRYTVTSEYSGNSDTASFRFNPANQD